MNLQPRYVRRYSLLNHLNRVSSLAEQLNIQLTSAAELLFGAADCGIGEVSSCLESASQCATQAKETLRILEESIKQSKSTADRIKVFQSK